MSTKQLTWLMDTLDACAQCERSLVTGFQLSSPDAIYNQDGKRKGEDQVLSEVIKFVCAGLPHDVSVHGGVASDKGLSSPGVLFIVKLFTKNI